MAIRTYNIDITYEIKDNATDEIRTELITDKVTTYYKWGTDEFHEIIDVKVKQVTKEIAESLEDGGVIKLLNYTVLR